MAPDSGARDRAESMLHSDALHSAVSAAMGRLGLLDEWLSATFAHPDGPAVRFSSCYPFLNEISFAVPPFSLWPPTPSLRIRWKGARFVPLPVVERLVAGLPLDEERWKVDGASRCLLPAQLGDGPFRTAVRSSAVVDRVSSGVVEAHRTGCLEFGPGGGMWALAAFSNDETKARWEQPVKAALRLLGDSGIGGKRSSGWGLSKEVEFVDGVLPDLILATEPAEPAAEGAEPKPALEFAYWLLSLFSPRETDGVDWERGNYALLTRSGRVESPAGGGALKKLTRMVAEGSVLFAGTPPAGAAPDVAPEGAPHPVYRAGFAVAIPIPWREVAR